MNFCWQESDVDTVFIDRFIVFEGTDLICEEIFLLAKKLICKTIYSLFWNKLLFDILHWVKNFFSGKFVSRTFYQKLVVRPSISFHVYVLRLGFDYVCPYYT